VTSYQAQILKNKKELGILLLYNKYTRPLTFENFWQAVDIPDSRIMIINPQVSVVGHAAVAGKQKYQQGGREEEGVRE